MDEYFNLCESYIAVSRDILLPVSCVGVGCTVRVLAIITDV